MDYKEIKKNVANALRILRKERKLTQDRVANDLYVRGVSKKTYVSYENDKGKNLPSIEKLVIIAEYYNVSLDYLVRGRSTTFDDDYSWSATFKRINRLLYSFALIPVGGEEGKCYFISHDKEVELYMYNLTNECKNINFLFQQGMLRLEPDIRLYDVVVDRTFVNPFVSLKPTEERLNETLAHFGFVSTKEQLEEYAKQYIDKIKDK